MSIKSAATIAATLTGITVAAAAFGAAPANAFVYAAHENSYATPTGFGFTVGHTDMAAHPVAPQNGLPTTREVFLNNTSYGRVDSPGTGTLKSGYLVSCMVGIELTFGAHAGAGIDAGVTLSVGGSPDALEPSLDAGIGPEISASVDLDLEITPGVIKRIETGTKELSGNRTGYVMSRDFHLIAEGCGGPLTIRPFTTIDVESPEATTNGAVYGDPIVF
ncbi:MspA family porin [Nocardia sp. XZ_19_385]|uniref:MspA family porin n=1 Tax=Nocardia sp. XZ_19_385 TaxID=2769488 RepID=UPI00188F5C50|nr:MspA family porin [Nocardia sp. XZ_19_385]